ncbi:hypothetical protein BKA59DRAFT_448503 [Fusarium tricinctum]|uniref:Uncharacterized protein n=1 Tax=Fusarium tricinctum TaxID=61284 RepID=A0A8K0S6Y2_9HYPO|nr:hypothetical protein BKA59DRAFT_448503 [Fusarium tricinctum]
MAGRKKKQPPPLQRPPRVGMTDEEASGSPYREQRFLGLFVSDEIAAERALHAVVCYSRTHIAVAYSLGDISCLLVRHHRAGLPPETRQTFFVLSRSLERLEKAPVRLNLDMIGPHMTMTYSATSPSNRLGKGFSLLPVVHRAGALIIVIALVMAKSLLKLHVIGVAFNRPYDQQVLIMDRDLLQTLDYRVELNFNRLATKLESGF